MWANSSRVRSARAVGMGAHRHRLAVAARLGCAQAKAVRHAGRNDLPLEAILLCQVGGETVLGGGKGGGKAGGAHRVVASRRALYDAVMLRHDAGTPARLTSCARKCWPSS